MDLAFLPAVNASLNALAAVLLVVGRILIRRGKVEAHRRTMIGAFGVSTLFLFLYVVYKSARGFESLSYNAVGWAKAAYLLVLFTHLGMAMTVPVLAILLLRWARTPRHARLARVAWPIWIYVSVTGVVIYVLLHHLNPAPVG